MNLTALQRNGLKLVLSIIKNENSGPVQAPQIAEQENLKVGYVGKILFMLRHAGLIKAVRGRKGGYTLSRDKSEITLFDVLKALEVKEFEHECPNLKKGDKCAHSLDCALRPVMQDIEKYIHIITKSVSLSDLCMQENTMKEKLDYFKQSAKEA